MNGVPPEMVDSLISASGFREMELLDVPYFDYKMAFYQDPPI